MTISTNIALLPRIPARGVAGVLLGLGDGYATPTLDGGWQTLTRLRRTSTTDYEGGAPISQTIPFVLDGTEGGYEKSVESSMSALYNLMIRQVGPFDQPTVFTIRGVPIPFFNLLWVLTDISITSEIRRSSDGLRVQVLGSITVMQYVGASVILSPAKRVKKKHKRGSHKSPHKHHHGSVRHYIVKRGDTLQKIAAKEYHKSSEWHRIASANNIRDPKSIKPGQKLKIPKG